MATLSQAWWSGSIRHPRGDTFREVPIHLLIQQSTSGPSSISTTLFALIGQAAWFINSPSRSSRQTVRVFLGTNFALRPVSGTTGISVFQAIPELTQASPSAVCPRCPYVLASSEHNLLHHT